MSGLLAPALVLTRYDTHQALESLRKRDEEDQVANELWKRIHRTWTTRGMNNTVVLHLSRPELKLMREIGATTGKRVVECRYLAIFRHPESGQEVRLKTHDRPPKRKTFRVPGEGRKKFIRVKLYRIRPKESIGNMARTRTKKQTEPEDIEELEGLEELDDIEADEPDDDEEVEETPKRKRRSRTAKTETPTRKKRSRAKVEEPEDEEDEEDDEEDEEPAPKKRSRSKTTAKTSTGKGKASSNGKSAAGRTTKELTGGVGSAELAEAASDLADLEITGRDVRVWLRKNEVEKDEESGRYTWPSLTNKGFVKLAKAIAKDMAE